MLFPMSIDIPEVPEYRIHFMLISNRKVSIPFVADYDEISSLSVKHGEIVKYLKRVT